MNSNKLNFLLVMPRLVQNIGDGYVFPLGIAFISSSLKRAGFNVFTLNLNHIEDSVYDIMKKTITEHNIDVVATGALSPQYHMLKIIIESAKKIKPSIKTILGGGIISAEPEIAMEALEYADYGVIGEGEETICELCEYIQNSGNLEDVDGIIFKKDDKYITTAKRADIKDLDSIAWPDYEGFDIDKYLEVAPASFGGVSGTRMITMLGSRSCPYKCSFCFHTNGSKYRKRSLDDFFKELDYLTSNYNINYISMADELFALDFEQTKEFSERIKTYNIAWCADFRVDRLNPDLLPIMKDSGLDVMFFGLESADNDILKSMRKKITIEKTEAALKVVTDAGIAVYGCFIFGDIAETKESANKTFKWWREHLDYNIHLTLIKPFPGSQIYRYACETGLIKDKIQYLKDGCPQINISKLNDEEFADIVHQISVAPTLSRSIESLQLIDYDSVLGRQTISGICPSCKHENSWKDIKLFANDYLFCEKCLQKFATPCPDKLRNNIDKNIDLLIKKYNKVAIWGMTIDIMDMFKDSKILKKDNIYPIDISESKRKLSLYGKTIYPPEILEDENIKIVIIAIPSHAGQISCQIDENHTNITKVIDLGKLITDNLVGY